MSEQFSRSKSSVHPISSLSANKQSAADEGSDVESIDELPEDIAQAEDDVELYVPTDTTGLKTHDGYEEVEFQQSSYLPPPQPLPFDHVKGTKMEFGKGADISKEDARLALLEFVAGNRCFGKGAAESMVISTIRPTHALHYTLETFREGRTTSRKERPLRANSEANDQTEAKPPKPWDIKCVPERMFENYKHTVPVPHTSEVRGCGLCKGVGFVKCGECKGYRKVKCWACKGKGAMHGHKVMHCGTCEGKGRRGCKSCNKKGKIDCRHCTGVGRVENFIELCVTYTNDSLDFILEETEMPDHLVRDVSGVELFQQELPQVEPITTFSVHHINENSIRMVEESRVASPKERQISQRQTLRAVPVSEVAYNFKDKASVFWVYGKERRVCAPDYPQQCCWGCNVL